MKYAVISVSAEGARLGQKVRAALGGDGTCYERKGAESGEDAVLFTRTLALTDEIFSRYDGLLYIMASGIVVRAVAPHVVSKASDPAVLVMDECGRHCISLLSGHLGGANAWTREVAAAAGADPVVTTATDVHGRRAPDDLARMMGMKVEPLSALKPVNSAIAEGKPFGWYLDMSLSGAEALREKALSLGVALEDVEKAEKEKPDAAAVVSMNDIPLSIPHVYLRPENIYVGVGCKRGMAESHIEDAVAAALKAAGVLPCQVASFASVTVKADEEGLLAMAAKRKKPIRFYTPEELEQCRAACHLEESPFVKKTIGVGNVCETAALLAAEQGKILLPKTRYHGVTAAVVMGLSVSSASGRVTRKK